MGTIHLIVPVPPPVVAEVEVQLNTFVVCDLTRSVVLVMVGCTEGADDGWTVVSPVDGLVGVGSCTSILGRPVG